LLEESNQSIGALLVWYYSQTWWYCWWTCQIENQTENQAVKPTTSHKPMRVTSHMDQRKSHGSQMNPTRDPIKDPTKKIPQRQ
jgi:hypothetical protein